MTTFFSIDVETSSTNPETGSLLTIGGVAVDEATRQIVGDSFYVRLGITPRWNPETQAWWHGQHDEAKRELFDKYLVRHDPYTAALMLREWVLDTSPHDDDDEGRIFVANPVSFDWPWINKLLSSTLVDNPFHYRTLCLRSMRYGAQTAEKWGDRGRSTVPAIKHHALHDARAQAADLINLLTSKERAFELCGRH